jgi:adenylosuccinate lyase
MTTENLLMAAVQAGGDRQAVHERIRAHSLAAQERIKAGDGRNDLIDRLRDDPAFARVDVTAVLDPSRFVGRAPEQVAAFLEREVEPIRRRYPGLLGQRREVEV